MYHPKRPAPLVYGVAGATCTAGAVAVTIRAVIKFTPLTVAEPFDTASFLAAMLFAVGGPIIVGWMLTRSSRATIAALQAEVRELRERGRQHEELLVAIQASDAQGEVNNVLLRRLLKATEERASEITQPIANLHSITGGRN